MSFETNAKLEIGLKLFNISGSKQAFLIRGIKIASLRSSGISPADKDKLTTLVMTGTKDTRHFFAIEVGSGSIRLDLPGYSLISLHVSLSIVGSNSFNGIFQVDLYFLQNEYYLYHLIGFL